MKKFVIAFVILTGVLSAQGFETASGAKRNLFYADLISKAATLNGDWGLFGGMRAGYNISENVSIGLIGHGFIPDYLGGSYANQPGKDELHTGYGGLEGIYNYKLSEKFSLAAMVMIGAGRVDFEKAPGYDYYFVTEPGMSANYFLTEWFGLGFSANYRFASGVNYENLSDASMSGWSTDINFKFGF